MSYKKFSSTQGAPIPIDGPPHKASRGDEPKAGPAVDRAAAPPENALNEEMAKYGITRVPVDYFHFRGFRYTNLKDAVAQAKRAIRR